MQESFIKKGRLISESEWHFHINNLRKESEILKEKWKDKSYEDLKTDLKRAIINAIEKRCPEKSKERFAIFFSGGVDSSTIALICKELKNDFVCYTVGYKSEESETAQDILYARRVAKSLNVKLIEKEFDADESEKIIKTVIRFLQIKNKDKIDASAIVNVGVGSVVVAAQSLAKEKMFFSGLGSEEIFAGYDRHLKAENKHEECWKGLKQMWKRDLLRDFAICSKLGIEVRTPFLDEDVIKIAMQIDISKKINSEQKKIVLREIAEELGLKKEFAWRKKLGAQYGSKFDRALERLAKNNGVRYKKEYVEKILNI